MSCINVNILILDYCFVGSYHWGKQSKVYMGSLYNFLQLHMTHLNLSSNYLSPIT